MWFWILIVVFCGIISCILYMLREESRKADLMAALCAKENKRRTYHQISTFRYRDWIYQDGVVLRAGQCVIMIGLDYVGILDSDATAKILGFNEYGDVLVKLPGGEVEETTRSQFRLIGDCPK